MQRETTVEEAMVFAAKAEAELRADRMEACGSLGRRPTGNPPGDYARARAKRLHACDPAVSRQQRRKHARLEACACN